MLDHIDTCIVGAGVVGLAIARRLSFSTKSLFVLEQGNSIGQGISSRNSEVIHAGIYYPEGSLKSTLCVQGNKALYQYCLSRDIPFSNCGKLIIAQSEIETSGLEKLLSQAKSNGILDLEFWNKKQIREREPLLKAHLALYSPSTGIVDSHALMSAYLADIFNTGGEIVTKTKVVAVKYQSERFVISCLIDNNPYQFTSRVLVNSAGLGAQSLASVCDFLDPSSIPKLYLCKGSYVSYLPKNPFSHLIYPLPDDNGAGLGVHGTIDTGGQLKFGPDTEYVDVEDYRPSEDIIKRYFEQIRRFYPGVNLSDLQLAYSGIRPKLQGPQDAVKDFVIESDKDHGIPGLIQLFGIESPGLTASMAIGDHVANLLAE
ncbi:MAG: L-2-hydroxyglutarate oxidase LhgO [Candidatus Azotimanducaceae bacterium]|jgi:L-2-hydroxyglutarate oxidase LhgO